MYPTSWGAGELGAGELGSWGAGERIDSNSLISLYTRIFLQKRDAPHRTRHRNFSCELGRKACPIKGFLKLVQDLSIYLSYQIRIYNPSNHPYLLLFFTLRTLSLCGSFKKGLFNPDFVSL
jgi:hypothetical protein